MLPMGSSEHVVASGLTKPTAFDIAADGRVFVAEQRGVNDVFDNVLDPTASVLADPRTSVHHFWDRGLLGLVVDPAFPDRPYVYVLYDHDAPPGGLTPVWGQAGSDSDGCHPDIGRALEDGCVGATRVSRLTIDDGGAVTETVLVGDVCTQVPAHTGGGLAFDEQSGALYAAFGDGAWSFSGARAAGPRRSVVDAVPDHTLDPGLLGHLGGHQLHDPPVEDARHHVAR